MSSMCMQDVTATDLVRLARSLSSETVLDSTRNQARKTSSHMLIIFGIIPEMGYVDESHQAAIKLSMLVARQGDTKTAVYEVLRLDLLDKIVDELEFNGGYRASLIDPEGEIVQGFQL